MATCRALGMEEVLRSCILLPPGHRRAVNHCAMAETEPGLGKTGVLGPVHHHTSHPVAQPHSHPYIHMVPDTVAQPKVDIATHSHTTYPQAHKLLLATYTYMHGHVLSQLHSYPQCHILTHIHSHVHTWRCLYMSSVHYVSLSYGITLSHTTVSCTQSYPHKVIHANCHKVTCEHSKGVPHVPPSGAVCVNHLQPSVIIHHLTPPY